MRAVGEADELDRACRRPGVPRAGVELALDGVRRRASTSENVIAALLVTTCWPSAGPSVKASTGSVRSIPVVLTRGGLSDVADVVGGADP